MEAFLEEIEAKAKEIVGKTDLVLVSVKKTHDFGVNIVRVIVDNPTSFDIDLDLVASINQELLDEVNDLLPDGFYLEVSSVGIERELLNDSDFEKAIGKYIYIKTYEKLEAVKDNEVYGDLVSYDDESVTINAVIKTRRKEIKVARSLIAKIRLAVKF